MRSIHSAQHVVTNRGEVIRIFQPLKACAESIIGRGKTRQITVDMHKPGGPADRRFWPFEASGHRVDLKSSSIERS